MALQPIGLDATLTNVPNFTSGIDKMNQAVDSFAQNGSGQGNAFSKGFGEIVTGALRKIGELAVDALAKGTQAIAGFVKDSIGVAGDFQQEFAQFQVAVGHTIDGSGKSLNDFKDLFISLGKELPVSTQEVEQAAVEMARGGIDPAVIAAGGLKQTIQFAAAALKGDLVSAAQISAKTMQAWTSITDSAATKTTFLTHAQNLMTQATTAASTTVDQLFLGLSNVGGTARLAGVSFDETVKALAQLTPSFASSADAGTSLKTFFARLQPETKPAIAAMQELGLYTKAGGSAFYDAKGNFIGMQAAEDLLQKATAGLTNAQREQALQTIFGNDAIRAAGVFALQGQAGYDALSTSISKQTTLTDAAAITQATYNTAVENAKGSVEALQITVGSALLPILTNLFNNTIAPAVNTLTDFSTAFLKMVPAIEASDDPFHTFMLAVAVAAPGLTDLVFQVIRFADSLKPAIAEFGRLSDAFSSGGLGGFIDALKTDITAALPSIQAALLKWGQALVDWIAPMIPPALTALGNLVSSAWDWVKAQTPGWGQQLLTWGKELVAWVAPMIPPALVELGKLGQQLLGWVGDQAAPLLKKLNDWATSFVAWIPGATVKFLAEWPKMLNTFLDWIGGAAGPLLKKLGDWAVSFTAWIIPMIPGFLLALGGIALAIGTFIVETAVVLNKKVLDWGIAMTAWVGASIPTLLKALGDMWTNINTWGIQVEKDLGAKMSDVGKSMVEGIQKGIADMWGTFTSWIHAQIMKIPEAVRIALGITSPSKVMADLVGVPVVQGIMQGMGDTLPSLVGVASTTASALMDALTQHVQDGKAKLQAELDATVASIAPGLTAMQQGVGQIGAAIADTFQNGTLIDAFKQVGVDAMAGFGAGLTAGVRKVTAIVNSTANTVQGAFQDAFQSHSPAQTMVPIGASVMQGIMQGMGDTLPSLVGVATTTAEALMDALTRHIQDGKAKLQEQLDAIVASIKDIGQQIQGVIADSFGSTASIDRQIAANLDKLKDVLPQYLDYVTNALNDAKQQASSFLDPTEGAKYFAMRSKQILEYADLQKKLNDAATQDDKDRIQAQMNLINAAQTAEIGQFNANQAGKASPAQDIATQIQQLLGSQLVPGLLSNDIVKQLYGLLGQIQSPPSTTAPVYNPGATATTNSTTLNMPIYTNQSPGVLQDSMAIAGAALL